MQKKPLWIAAIGVTVAAMGFSTQASAGDPIAGAIIGGGIGAAVAGPPGAAVGAIIGTIAGSTTPYYGGYYPEPADYGGGYGGQRY